MNKRLFMLMVVAMLIVSAKAQEEEEPRGFRKENLFTGGGISLGFGTGSFQVGATPIIGYSVSSWLDAGVALNYNYASFNRVYLYNENDKIRRSTYGPGGFIRVYPVNFLFLHGQFEHNFITETFIPGDGAPRVKSKTEANSMLVGAGYATGRSSGGGQPFFYLSLLFDILNSDFSPYRNSNGNIAPFIRAGFQVPLFQGRRGY